MSKKILIVEDAQVIAKAISNALGDAGFIVDSATNGTDGLEKIKNENYDLVILDLVLPDKTGFDVLNDLKFNDNGTQIIVYSNMIEDCTKEDVIKAGAKAFFNKLDISLDEIVEEVKRLTEAEVAVAVEKQ